MCVLLILQLATMGFALLLVLVAVANAMPHDDDDNASAVRDESAPVYYPPSSLPNNDNEDNVIFWALPSLNGQDDDNSTVSMERLYGSITETQALTLAYGPDYAKILGIEVVSGEEEQDQIMREEDMYMEEGEEEEESHRIIGGFYAKPGQFPFIVRLGNL